MTTHPLRDYINHSRMDRLWDAYENASSDGDIPDLGSLGLTYFERSSRMGFTSLNMPGVQNTEGSETVGKLIVLWLEINGEVFINMEEKSEDHNTTDKERCVFELCMSFLRATELGSIKHMREFIDAGVPVNFQNPKTKETALHLAATGGSSKVVETLIDTDQCDYLIRDKRGKLAYDNAVYFGKTIEVEELILEKTMAQADKEKIDLFEESKTYLQQWIHEPWYHARTNNIYVKFDDHDEPIISDREP